MTAIAESKRVIWRFTDGRAGHDAQSTGLVSALSRAKHCQAFDVTTPFNPSFYFPALCKQAPGLAHLPDPDLLVGAGHATHLPMLACRFVRKGRIVVIMKPSLPASLFDLCLIPEHDQTAAAGNILLTAGPLNNIQAQDNTSPEHNLVLIGGPSKHFNWSDSEIQKQLELVLAGDGPWLASDSPRTPRSMRNLLKDMEGDRLRYCPYEQHPAAGLLEKAGSVWVSEDSMSMIYEALSSGAAVGVLAVPPRGRSRLAAVANKLSEKRLITRFRDWQDSRSLIAPRQALQESTRVAGVIVDELGW